MELKIIEHIVFGLVAVLLLGSIIKSLLTKSDNSRFFFWVAGQVLKTFLVVLIIIYFYYVIE